MSKQYRIEMPPKPDPAHTVGGISYGPHEVAQRYDEATGKWITVGVSTDWGETYKPPEAT